MSRIEDALKKLQGSRSQAARVTQAAANGGGRAAPLPRSAVPVARKKKVEVVGEKHHVSQADLIRAGLLAPLEQAVPVADEFRRIKRPLIQNAALSTPGLGAPMNAIMIASALPKAGKTFCSVNLAVSISLERELNVLLVDADVAKPQISREFGFGEMPGLIDLLVDDSLGIESTLIRTDLNDIQVLPAGKSHPQATELLSSDRMSVIISELATRYPDRIIILDSPPLLITSEAQALAGQVGQIAVVVEAGETSRQVLDQTLEALDADKAVNLILNKTRHWSRGYYGDAYGYYGYEGGFETA